MKFKQKRIHIYDSNWYCIYIVIIASQPSRGKWLYSSFPPQKPIGQIALFSIRGQICHHVSCEQVSFSYKTNWQITNRFSAKRIVASIIPWTPVILGITIAKNNYFNFCQYSFISFFHLLNCILHAIIRKIQNFQLLK